jgi:hypothetical protein
VNLQFVIVADFSTKLWQWCGQYVGEDFWGQFVQVVKTEEKDENQLELEGDDAEAAEEDEQEDE